MKHIGKMLTHDDRSQRFKALLHVRFESLSVVVDFRLLPLVAPFDTLFGNSAAGVDFDIWEGVDLDKWEWVDLDKWEDLDRLVFFKTCVGVTSGVGVTICLGMTIGVRATTGFWITRGRAGSWVTMSGVSFTLGVGDLALHKIVNHIHVFSLSTTQITVTLFVAMNKAVILDVQAS